VNLKSFRGWLCDLRLHIVSERARSPKANAGQRTSNASRARHSNFVKQQGIIQSDEVKACRALHSRRQVLCSPDTAQRQNGEEK
jgi:hypothetical protein